MTVATAKQKNRLGRRKHLAAPRKQRCVYMTEQTYAAIREWVQAERQDGRNASVCDAIEEMVDIASYFSVDTNAALRHQPLGSLANKLIALGQIPNHIRVEPNTGRSVRCSHCRVQKKIAARRFSGVLRELTAFAQQHMHDDSDLPPCYDD